MDALARAEALVGGALNIRRRLTQANSDDSQAGDDLATVLEGQAGAVHEQGEVQEAFRLQEEAVAIREDLFAKSPNAWQAERWARSLKQWGEMLAAHESPDREAQLAPVAERFVALCDGLLEAGPLPQDLQPLCGALKNQ